MSAFSKSASAVTLGPNSLSKAAEEPKQSHSSQLHYVNYQKKKKKEGRLKMDFTGLCCGMSAFSWMYFDSLSQKEDAAGKKGGRRGIISFIGSLYNVG